jgi:hypothetical protein
MRDWKGLAGDVNAISDGAQFIRNVSFDIEGELARRLALEKMNATSSTLGISTYGPPIGGQYVVQVTAAGTVEVISA